MVRGKFNFNHLIYGDVGDGRNTVDGRNHVQLNGWLNPTNTYQLVPDSFHPVVMDGEGMGLIQFQPLDICSWGYSMI